MTTTPHLIVRRASERGHASHGWLESWHTFSFADYYEPSQMGFRSLRVINEDRIAPGGGFPAHPHKDMEIFSYLLEGSLAHEDSMGNSRVLRPGEIQLMRAGTGVRHSEFNPSTSSPAHLLQIWITPAERALAPAYTEWAPRRDQEAELKTLVISSDGREGSAMIAQDASIYLIKLQPGQSASHHLSGGRGLWLHIARGAVTVNGIDLSAGDAISTEQAGEISMNAVSDMVEAILFDLY